MTEPIGPILHLILAEASLELVPPALWSHPAVSKPARTRGKKPGETLLDDSFHHSAMNQAAKRKEFDDTGRRGRPDIAHTALLVALESRLNKDGRLRVWIHTRDDRLLRFRWDVRLQRAQHRFYGLMERLLIDGVVPQGAKDEDALIFAEDQVTLGAALNRIGADRVIVCDESGTTESIEKAIVSGLPQTGTVAVVVGAYPEGPFRSDLSEIPHERLALGPVALTAWSVVSEVVVRFRSATGGD